MSRFGVPPPNHNRRLSDFRREGVGVSTMAAERGFSGDALPVCLRSENPNRLVSLWDLVNNFIVANFCGMYENIRLCEFQLRERRQRNANSIIGPDVVDHIRFVLGFARQECERISLNNSLTQVHNALAQIDNMQNHDLAMIETRLTSIREAIIGEIGSRKFLWISPDRYI